VTPGDYVMLAVSDTGMGMSTTVQAHLFEPFFTTKAPGKGTGLGLATCYAIVRRFDGHIGVYSEPGKGTVMKVYLPAVHHVEADAALSVNTDAKVGRETILLVEDEAQVRAVAARMLRARGFVVLEAGDGEAALQLLQAHPGDVDLLLTDVVLPKMGGRVLAEHVVAMRPNIRVLFASGYTEDVILHHRLLKRGIALLHKPFSSDSLVGKVRETLDRPPEPEDPDEAEISTSPYLDHATPVTPTTESRPRPASNVAADRQALSGGPPRIDSPTPRLPS
jgi:two-component system, cell cycle sensor histidine kinase and response regulator CckA